MQCIKTKNSSKSSINMIIEKNNDKQLSPAIAYTKIHIHFTL